MSPRVDVKESFLFLLCHPATARSFLAREPEKPGLVLLPWGAINGKEIIAVKIAPDRPPVR